MTKTRNLKKLWLVTIATPAILSMVAALWPLEPFVLILACILLGVSTFVVTLFASSLRQLMVGMAALAVLLSVATTNWSLQAAYALSRPSSATRSNEGRDNA